MSIKDLGKKLQYYLNDLLIRNPLWQIMFLVFLSAVLIIAAMVLVKGHMITRRGEAAETEFWWSFTRLMDQGTFIDDDEYDTRAKTVGVMITLSGIMILSLLIGILSSKINEQLEKLKKGRSAILEKNHYLVCGNGDRLYEVTRELIKARKDERLGNKRSIVMFSGSSREEMEELMTQRAGRKSVKQVLCRSGEVKDIDALRLVGFDKSSGFVIIGENDESVLKTLIAVSALCETDKTVGVCEIRNRSMQKVAESAYGNVCCVPVREVVMRLLVQICRQPGLSAVYKELLSFDGNEFYLCSERKGTGLPMKDIYLRQSGGVVAGIQKNGKVHLNPSSDVVYEEGDKLLILSEHHDSFRLLPVTRKPGSVLIHEPEPVKKLFRMLVFSGYSRNFGPMLGLLNDYSEEGAEITVAGSLPAAEGQKCVNEELLTNCNVTYLSMDRTVPEEVKSLNPEKFNSIMVLSGKQIGDTDEKADFECIVTLLIIKRIREDAGNNWNGTVVAEIRNPRNRKLATAAEIDDFVISNEVCSMIMAQLVRQKDLGPVYKEIFTPAGSEIYLRCGSQYTRGSFYDLEIQGRRRGEIVLGWLTGRGNKAKVTLNPSRNKIMPESKNIKIIAIAER
ncbi:hypothetical protein CSA37_08035 [Candidatus Fermentibacteria bacterium]|nr:MAG: hypothetical protein CSA37_08035 [Candidatus Fermentibacteria bacterium]